MIVHNIYILIKISKKCVPHFIYSWFILNLYLLIFFFLYLYKYIKHLKKMLETNLNKFWRFDQKCTYSSCTNIFLLFIKKLRKPSNYMRTKIKN